MGLSMSSDVMYLVFFLFGAVSGILGTFLWAVYRAKDKEK